ncbi:sugar ABC transporter substrate-binding protein [Streptomyces chartreusis]
MFKSRAIPTALAVILSSVLAGCSAASSESDYAGTVKPGFERSVRESVEAAKAPQRPLRIEGPAAVPGKRIAIVSVTLAETGALRTAKALRSAATDAGWSSTTYDGQGSPTVANQKLEQAVTTRPDAIVLISLDPTDVGSGLQAAKNAKIPVTCAACWDLKTRDTKGEYYADVQPSIRVFENLGYLTAQYAYLKTEGHPHFLTMNDPALSNLAARTRGFQRFIKECADADGDCRVVRHKDFQVANATTTLSAEGAALARANPSFNAFWVGFDFAGLQVLTGLQQANLASGDGKSFMVASNGDGANLKVIKSGGYIKATIAISFEQEAYAAIDNLNRMFAGKPLVEHTVPIRLFDATNAEEARNGNWSGDVDYRAVYRKVWHG